MLEFTGHIVVTAFDSGDRFLCGVWDRSPFGAFTDIMWATSDGKRILLSSNEDAAKFISAHYEFHEVQMHHVTTSRTAYGYNVQAGAITIDVALGRRELLGRLLRLRPRVLRRSLKYLELEDKLLRPIVSRVFKMPESRSFVSTRLGVKQWYSVADLLPIERANARSSGKDLGDLIDCTECNFDHAAPPPKPSVIDVTTFFES